MINTVKTNTSPHVIPLGACALEHGFSRQAPVDPQGRGTLASLLFDGMPSVLPRGPRTPRRRVSPQRSARRPPPTCAVTLTSSHSHVCALSASSAWSSWGPMVWLRVQLVWCPFPAGSPLYLRRLQTRQAFAPELTRRLPPSVSCPRRTPGATERVQRIFQKNKMTTLLQR